MPTNKCIDFSGFNSLTAEPLSKDLCHVVYVCADDSPEAMAQLWPKVGQKLGEIGLYFSQFVALSSTGESPYTILETVMPFLSGASDKPILTSDGLIDPLKSIGAVQEAFKGAGQKRTYEQIACDIMTGKKADKMAHSILTNMAGSGLIVLENIVYQNPGRNVMIASYSLLWQAVINLIRQVEKQPLDVVVGPGSVGLLNFQVRPICRDMRNFIPKRS